ncbi:hypothetical protein SNEBB_000140 [Seison nebaliae]|nr:hypothetical protein SNEBB_000140 [Seison nebaliae]
MDRRIEQKYYKTNKKNFSTNKKSRKKVVNLTKAIDTDIKINNNSTIYEYYNFDSNLLKYLQEIDRFSFLRRLYPSGTKKSSVMIDRHKISNNANFNNRETVVKELERRSRKKKKKRPQSEMAPFVREDMNVRRVTKSVITIGRQSGTTNANTNQLKRRVIRPQSRHHIPLSQSVMSRIRNNRMKSNNEETKVKQSKKLKRIEGIVPMKIDKSSLLGLEDNSFILGNKKEKNRKKTKKMLIENKMNKEKPSRRKNDIKRVKIPVVVLRQGTKKKIGSKLSNNGQYISRYSRYSIMRRDVREMLKKRPKSMMVNATNQRPLNQQFNSTPINGVNLRRNNFPSNILRKRPYSLVPIRQSAPINRNSIISSLNDKRMSKQMKMNKYAMRLYSQRYIYPMENDLITLETAVDGMNKTHHAPTSKINISLSCGDFGDDCGSIFRNENALFILLADGVGGNRDNGIDPRTLPTTLLRMAKKYLVVQNAKSDEMLRAFSYGMKYIENNGILGSTTLCGVAIDPRSCTMTTLNLGDSGFVLLRRVRQNQQNSYYFVVKQSQPTSYMNDMYRTILNEKLVPNQLYCMAKEYNQHFFNETAIAKDSDIQKNIQLYDNDIIILGSDGLFDVFSPNQLCNVLNQMSHPLNVKNAASDILQQTFANYQSNSTTHDDVLVIVARVRETM